MTFAEAAPWIIGAGAGYTAATATQRSPKPKPPVLQPSAPVPTKGDPEVREAKEREARRLRRARGHGGTVLSPAFLQPASVRKETLG